MTSIPDAISRIWPNNFKRLCVKNKRFSIEFLLHYVISRRSSDDFVKKDESTSLSFYDIIDAEKSGYLNV